MIMSAERRLKIDEKESAEHKDHFVIHPKTRKVVTPDGTIASVSNYFSWEGEIYGPEDSPYAGGTFKINIDVPGEYPMRPPLITFVTPIYHPNIRHDGQICLDILKLPAWSPALGINRALLSIIVLLSAPNGSDPLNEEAGLLLEKDPKEFKARATGWTAEHAMGL